MTKGLQLAESFYNDFGRPAIHSRFPSLETRLAIGLAGEGSECFGFDDEISRDHDFGAAFCIWITDDDYENYSNDLITLYESLPSTFNGLKTKLKPSETLGRVGVMKISDFYSNMLGIAYPPQTNKDWLKIKEYQLATSVNGKVFRDDLGLFSDIRNSLLEYYPKDVWLKRLAASLAKMAQSGQYNYIRALRRYDDYTAFLMLSDFVHSCINTIYLLNKSYRPFDKWLFKGMDNFDILVDAKLKLKQLISCSNSKTDKVLLIESICEDIIKELHKLNLSNSKDDFLMTHAIDVTRKIKDLDLLQMNIFTDEL